MSALPPKADKEQTCPHVRLVPLATECSAAKNYSITSSASASNVGGTSMPSAVAVTLTKNYSGVGCCTGSSAGFAPLIMLALSLLASKSWALVNYQGSF